MPTGREAAGGAGGELRARVAAVCERLLAGLHDAGQRDDRLVGLATKLFVRALFARRGYELGAPVDGGWITGDAELDSMGPPNCVDSLDFAQLHDLPRIFEIATVEIERLSAAAIQPITRRKRDGVYYTPAWATRYIVEAIVGERLREQPGPGARAELLETITIVDPSCGAGAFLLAAFEYLLEQRRRLAAELGEPFDEAAVAKAIVEVNLHGVDLSPAAVDFTRRILRLRAATLGATPRESTDNIRCGDALIDFAWQRTFSSVFERPEPGFDCVIGNPPYVKLQHFRRTREEVAHYLISARTSDDRPLYQSTQTGNFDLYLPFIEKGVGLLAPRGLLGYLAPSAWLSSEYGEGLRQFLRRTRALDRWIDFEGYQVFADATTYTAVQLFSRRPRAAIRCAFAPAGPADLARIEWSSQGYAELPETGAWRLLPPLERALWDRLRARCRPLGEVCEQIAVGVQTSADHIYHLERCGPGRYRGLDGVEVQLEDAIMRPLLSGAEVNRYEAPRTTTYLLFPYSVSEDRPALIPAQVMREQFPLAWAYLRGRERELRSRERHKMDHDDRWWGYNYPKNLAKQALPKLVVAQTVPSLRVAYDVDGRHCLNNVRVNGVFCKTVEDAWFLLAILNGPVADFVFRAIAKRKVGGYFEANKQYIAPLPIPEASTEQRRELGASAMRLQELHTRRARLVGECDALLGSSDFVDEVRDRGFVRVEIDDLDSRLRPRVVIRVDAQLRVWLGETLALRGVVKRSDRSEFLVAQWRHEARRIRVTPKFNGKALLRRLLRLRSTTNAGRIRELVELDAAIVELDATLAAAERSLDERAYRLYGLSDAERHLIASG